MTKKCESCFGIEENVGTEEFIQCAHESYKSNDSAMHKIGIRFADVDATIDILDNHMSQAEDNIATLQDQTGQLEKDIVGINTELDSLGKRLDSAETTIENLHEKDKSLDADIKDVNGRMDVLDEEAMKKAVYDPAGGARQVQFEQDDRLTNDEKTVVGAINELIENKAEKAKTVQSNIAKDSKLFSDTAGSCLKDDMGTVFVLINATTITPLPNKYDTYLIGYLPVGYRPKQVQLFSVELRSFDSGVEAANAKVYPNGAIHIYRTLSCSSQTLKLIQGSTCFKANIG